MKKLSMAALLSFCICSGFFKIQADSIFRRWREGKYRRHTSQRASSASRTQQVQEKAKEDMQALKQKAASAQERLRKEWREFSESRRDA